MLRDPMLLVNIQLAIMGIVVVAGLFYLWRLICRLERKVDEYIANAGARNYMTRMSGGGEGGDNLDGDDEDAADLFMKEVFGDSPAAALVINTPPPCFSTSAAPPESTTTSVNVVEIDEEPVASEADTTVSMSKSKLKRMSVEALREVCKEKGLSTEGTKATLLDRIIESEKEEDFLPN